MSEGRRIHREPRKGRGQNSAFESVTFIEREREREQVRIKMS